MESNDENRDDRDVERIPDEHFRRRNGNKWEKMLRPGVILVLLVWGSVLLTKTISSLQRCNNDRKDEDSGYRVPNSLYTEDGSLKVSLRNVRNGTFVPKLKSLQWISTPDSHVNDKGLFYTMSNETHVVRSVFDEDFSQVLFKGNSFKFEGESYKIDLLVTSPDLTRLLIRTETVSNWRHSTYGSYFVYNNATSEFDKIGDNLSLAIWSPNSLDIAYVQDNDIYIYSCKDRRTVRRVTDDGSSQVFNGRPDWVYEEEVLEDDRALWWSPKGDYFAFYKIDETEVGEFVIPYYVQSEEDVYSQLRSIKYPKSGTPNPKVGLWIYNLKDDFAYSVDLGYDETDPESSLLVTEVTWVGESKLITKTTDRSSDMLTVFFVNVLTRSSEPVRKTSSEGGWWEITHNTLYVPQDASSSRHSEGYVDVMPIKGYNHLVYFSPANDTEPRALTEGNWEVVNGPAAFDYEMNTVYFFGTKKSSTERHLYAVNLAEPKKLIEVTDTSKSGVYDASFSAGGRFALITYRGPGIPYQKIVDLRSSKTDKVVSGNVLGKTLFYLEKNENLRKELRKYAAPSKKFQELNLGPDDNGDDVVVNSYEILPNDFNETKKDYYPVFFYAYGGPNSQQVLQNFAIGFNEVIASQLDAIVVVVDGRGTGLKGTRFRSLVRDRLGDYEARDQISAAAQYGARSYVDADKISLFGWSYGGYLTLKTLEKDAGKHFKYGMAVAPVTDWRLYDSVYTERYMHTPQENPEGYAMASVANVTAIAHAKRFLLMHGTGDDNVHFQNSLKFLDLLDLHSVENYDVQIFPDSDHSIRYHNANNIVYDKLLSWAKLAYTGQFIN